MGQTNEQPIGLKVKEEKIAAVTLPQLECSFMDARSRKILIYLIEQELKRYKSYPKSWVEEPMKHLQGIKAGLEMCQKVRKRQDNAEQGTGATGKNGESAGTT